MRPVANKDERTNGRCGGRFLSRRGHAFTDTSYLTGIAIEDGVRRCRYCGLCNFEDGAKR